MNKNENKKHQKWIIAKEYIWITIAVAIITFSLEYFFFPNAIASGGISGFALVLNTVFDIEPSIIIFGFNIVLFILAFFLVGGSFGGKSIYASILVSVFMWITENLLNPRAITDNLFLASVFGSLIIALGTAIVFNQGSSTGGTSIIAKIINKYLHIPIGQGLLITDCTVTLLAMYVFGIELGLFGLFSAIIVGILVDKFIAGFNPVKQVFIVTSEEKLVMDFIIKDINRGCTILAGKGGFTGGDTSIIYTVLTSRQFITLKNFVKENNPNAFITVTDSTEALGEGFTEH
ncbi:YitT family protein [Clostridium sp.]|uniref:YitT family protein n=1 Tax=Clostridium sp. TaxID=1506 RepID=UPI002FC9412B